MPDPGAVLDRRRAGVLLHPTSLPPSRSGGVLGRPARRFVDFLAAAGVSVWQLLPLGPPHEDLSPYQAQSVHAGNPALIDVEQLAEWGWIEGGAGPDAPGEVEEYRRQRLAEARRRIVSQAGELHAELEAFRGRTAAWLDDFALFQSLREEAGGSAWWDWPAPLRDREPAALVAARERLAEAIAAHAFEQFVFFRQWQRLRAYAHERGVLLFGDLPIFVAHDSADVWANRDYFRLDERGQPVVIAGTPPDYFSRTGQKWGNPHYDWERMGEDGFQWWKARIASQLASFDLIRIDHFRGFEAFWEVPAEAPAASAGRWVKGPGSQLFDALRAHFGTLPLVAEDLGYITEDVYALRDRYGFPGMKVLQFAFDSGPDNPYLPHNHVRNCVVYSGTHDNNTTKGWYEELAAETRKAVRAYLGHPEEEMPWALLRTALRSVARLAILPMQDVLGLGAEHRLNVPGVSGGNWRWCFGWEQVTPAMERRLRELVRTYGREVTSGGNTRGDGEAL